jgi:uncharacterized protein YndB with AHSA1/START domain
MPTETVHVSDIIPATAKAIYDAFLDGDGHTAMTGGGSDCDARVGGKFTAWDGYIEGTNLELAAGKRIVQAWRSSEFDDKHGDSKLIVLLDKADGGTRVTFVHTYIPSLRGRARATSTGGRRTTSYR